MLLEVFTKFRQYDPVELVNDVFQTQFGLRSLTAREWKIDEDKFNICRILEISIPELCEIAANDKELHAIKCRGRTYVHPDGINTWYKNFAQQIVKRHNVIN